MTNILVECPQLIASVRMGVLEPLKPLEESGLCTLRFQETKAITRQDLCWCDVLICVRGCEYPTLRVVQAAKAAGRFVAYFLDDDLLNVPDGNASTRYYRDRKIKVNLTKILELCDVLWAVNKEILRRYSAWCSRTVLLRVPTNVLRLPPAYVEPIHILYAGSVDHSALVQEILTPVVRKILTEYPGRVDFTFIGADPGLSHVKGVVCYPFFESYEAYRQTVLSGEYAVGLAPVYLQPFYACKYYNKFIEYSSCGIAGVYSDCEPYRQIVRSGENGILCPNTFDGWFQALRQLIEVPRAAGELAAHAATQLRMEFNYPTVSQSLQLQLPEVVTFHAPDASKTEIHLPNMQQLFYQERILLLVRMYGPLAALVIPFKAIKKLYKMIWKKLRKK